MRIIVTGTPGTGKTVAAKAIAKQLRYPYLSLKKFTKDYNLRESYDKERKTYEVDTNKLVKELKKFLKNKKDIVIDGHLSHYLPKSYVDLCVVTKCSLKTLQQRLKKRRYSKAKIRENLDAEIFDVCLTEAKERGHKVKVIDTDKKYQHRLQI